MPPALLSSAPRARPRPCAARTPAWRRASVSRGKRRSASWRQGGGVAHVARVGREGARTRAAAAACGGACRRVGTWACVRRVRESRTRRGQRDLAKQQRGRGRGVAHCAHEGGCGRQRVVDKDEDGLLGRNGDALADDVDKLPDGQVHRDEVLALVHRRNVGARVLLANHRDPVRVSADPPRRTSIANQSGERASKVRPRRSASDERGKASEAAPSTGEVNRGDAAVSTEEVNSEKGGALLLANARRFRRSLLKRMISFVCKFASHL
eukprot:1201853-Pleurochrysis_carterae.AAC.4